MNKLLQINTSLNAGNGQSTRLANEFVAAFRDRHPDAEVVVRDLSQTPVPHLTAERFGAFLAKPGERTAAQQAVVDESDALINELKAADTIVLGLPLYNFGIPSTFKAYIDHIARVGVTFRYTDKGPVGLVTGKKVYVLAARGGIYAGTPLDTQTQYLRDFLRFIGITDVEFIYAEGLAMGDAPRQAALSKAHHAIQQLNGQALLAA